MATIESEAKDETLDLKHEIVTLKKKVATLEKLNEVWRSSVETNHAIHTKLLEALEDVVKGCDSMCKTIELNAKMIEWTQRDLLFIYKRLKRLDGCEGEADFEKLLKNEKDFNKLMEKTFGI